MRGWTLHLYTFATKRSVQLLHNALTTSYQAYSLRSDDFNARIATEKRGIDLRNNRRAGVMPIGFPERRFGERRGRARQVHA